jgi:hypothetical protein
LHDSLEIRQFQDQNLPSSDGCPWNGMGRWTHVRSDVGINAPPCSQDIRNSSLSSGFLDTCWNDTGRITLWDKANVYFYPKGPRNWDRIRGLATRLYVGYCFAPFASNLAWCRKQAIISAWIYTKIFRAFRTFHIKFFFFFFFFKYLRLIHW